MTEKQLKITYLVTAGLVVLVLVIGGVVLERRLGQMDEIAHALSAEKLELERELVEAREIEVEEAPEVINHSVNSAKDSGDKVSSIQNQMVDRYVKNKEVDVAGLASQMDELFAEDFASRLSRTPWYQMSVVGTKEKLPNLAWKFMSNYSFESNELPVLWLLLDESDQVYAYARSTFSAKDQHFHGFEKRVTDLGSKWDSGTVIPDGMTEDSNEGFRTMIEALQELVPETKMTPEELEAYQAAMEGIMEARYEARQANMPTEEVEP